MKRRDVIGLMGGFAASWPFAVFAQRPVVPKVGFFRSTPREPFAHLLAAFGNGMKEAGFVDGQNVTIEQRYADNHYDRLPVLASDLVGRGVSVIVGNIAAVKAAKAATDIIPIVFVAGDDPIKIGLVKNLNRPEGNLTGVTFFGGGHLGAKRVELLRDLVPDAAIVAVLLDPNYPGSDVELPNVLAAGRTVGRQIVVVKVAGEHEFEPAFVKIGQARAKALLVSGSPLFTSRRRALVALAQRHALPAIYDLRDFAVTGGLISYGASIANAYRQAGLYAGQILKGAKPAELPVERPTTFELVVNLRTAKALGIDVPQSILLRANEVIE